MNDAALTLLAVGGAAAALSRAGLTIRDFSDEIVLLTGVHFHYAGFALPVLTARALRARPGWFARATALAVVVLIPLVGVGITFSPGIEVAASLGLALACFAVAGLQVRAADEARSPIAWSLLAASALALVAGMSVAAVYAVGEYRVSCGIDSARSIDIPAMIPLHGALNGVGFALCGLLGWSVEMAARVSRNRLRQPRPEGTELVRKHGSASSGRSGRRPSARLS